MMPVPALLLVVAMMGISSVSSERKSARHDHDVVDRHLSINDHLTWEGVLPQPKKSFQPQHFYYIHIPKTGGESFMSDSPQYMPKGSKLNGNKEYGYFKTLRDVAKGFPNETLVTLLRDPISHVLSQFLECKYDSWGKKVTNNTNFPGYFQLENVMDGFDEWVSHFASLHNQNGRTNDAKFSYNCYNPWNMQARYMTTSQTFEHPHFVRNGDSRNPSIQKAKQKLNNIPIIGITKYYAASMCLLEFQALGGSLTPKCKMCNQSTNELVAIQTEHHEKHSVPTHSVDMINTETLQLVEQLTAVDRELYNYGLKLFFDQIQHVNDTIGVDLLCRQQHDYHQEASPMISQETSPVDRKIVHLWRTTATAATGNIAVFLILLVLGLVNWYRQHRK